MKKHIIIGLLIFAIILSSTIVLFLIKDSQNKETKNNNIEENKKLNIDSKANTPKENKEDEIMEKQEIKLYINDHKLNATLYENSSSKALIEQLQKGPLTINMSDYANMEKVGDLGINLPRNDEEISTSAGDLILYQGNNFVIYYDTNHWSLTRLGKINNISSQELKNILGKCNVMVKLSLN